ncbi:DNA-directed RNA polymerase subunit delta (RNAP delta factor) [Mycoplasma suis KI3806]|uniref:RNAP delta factor n=1 Tax=Mycoplasma suis (strain KI_3806) TaxID=708248 RepID=F0V3K0_MYCS3|nr:DNA-directed RNA polymerase subunit delta [Mycoplasma suis]CBZ40422.1 DNA-directed RNA polymerase subunit delta (RNAP delta factor) [Mycoplasma suis KI3806]
MTKLNLRDLINIANEVAIENFGQQSFNFQALWNKTWMKAKDFKKDSIENWIGPFYMELLSDPRFVYVGKNMWRLREYMEYSEYLKIMGKRAQKISFSEKELEGEDPVEEISSKEDESEDDIVEDEELESNNVSPESEEDSINDEIDSEGEGYSSGRKSNDDEDEDYE